LGRVLKILGRHRRLFDLKFDGTLTYSLNREAWEYENATRRIAGGGPRYGVTFFKTQL
jgi:hypothetical protein